MAIRFGSHSMTSDQTHHTATLDHTTDGWERWTITWLPGREIGRNQAVTAMVLAETCGWKSPHIPWPHVNSLAHELDLTGAQVINLIRKGRRPTDGSTQQGT